MAHTAIWAPGTIVQAEHPERLAESLRQGWGTSFKQREGFNWFHIPVATPSVLNNETLKLFTVFVFYRATNGPRIANVHLYDGGTRIEAFDGLSLAGDHTRETNQSAKSNMFDLQGKPAITSGLGISVGVDFRHGGEILFTGAGGRFHTASG
jgi:hypothetical protein